MFKETSKGNGKFFTESRANQTLNEASVHLKRTDMPVSFISLHCEIPTNGSFSLYADLKMQNLK